MGEFRVRYLSNDQLIRTIVDEMPRRAVSSRTNRTGDVSLAVALAHLAGGELGFSSEFNRAGYGELLGRIIANAESQGIEIPRSAEAWPQREGV